MGSESFSELQSALSLKALQNLCADLLPPHTHVGTLVLLG